MADESCYTLQDAMAIARAGAADVLSTYVGKGGGMDQHGKLPLLPKPPALPAR